MKKKKITLEDLEEALVTLESFYKVYAPNWELSIVLKNKDKIV